ncbi:uncharacterized protein LOC124302955 [Neodiprion virginianus]|uniref:uncharacterized protein LOC124302955 n=1 Tax=Neodiprion virginianus TaxID=2961670 RepID=UPI001EE7259A|nr:uncharacterized protein LOC124302955 [Neodiprion virginianus]
MMIKIAALMAIVAMARDVSAEVTTVPCTSNTTSSMENAVSGTMKNCESGLLGVKGLNSLLALDVNLNLNALVGPLLNNLVAELTPLLSSVLIDVVELLNTVLTAVVQIVNAVIELLDGLLSTNEFNSQTNSAVSNATSQVQSMCGCNSTDSSTDSSTGSSTGSLLTVVVNVLDGLLGVVANLNL